MTIAILPVLIESFAIGSVGVVAGMAVWYLFKHEKNTTESAQKNNEQSQTNASTTTPPGQSTAEPVISSAAEVTKKEEPKPAPVVAQAREQLSPQEQALRQQQLQDIQQMLLATTSPRPTDSALSRHFDAMIVAKAEDCLECATKMAQLKADYAACQNAASTLAASSTESCNEEPMLKRHHLHNVRMMVVATTFPRPTDSMLSRHYDEMIDAKAEDCLENEAKMARLLAEYEEYEKAQVSKKTPAAAKAVVSESKRGCIVPEDSMLRRHFLTNLRATIEKNKAQRPTDSALRRHYDAMINAEIENYLSFS